MKILAIETSCDETGLAIVDTATHDGTTTVTVCAEALLSQIAQHEAYGGVYPSLAKREHAKNIAPLFNEVLTQAGMCQPSEGPSVSKKTLDEVKDILEREPELFARLLLLFAQIQKPEIDAIAVTTGPGLEPALWVGVNFARALSHAWDIPIIPVNHMEGHIVSAYAQQTADGTFTLIDPPFPALALLISGGHTELVLMRDAQAYERIGATRDDAVGEAFDKSARLLGLPYPGGPAIATLAQEARDSHILKNVRTIRDDIDISLPRPMIATEDYDFSFSGLKTAVLNLVTTIGTPTNEEKQLIAKELEDAIADVLVAKTQRAIDEHSIRTVIVGGGVASNGHIRKRLEALVSEYPETTIHFPLLHLATDNGVMIALAGALRTHTAGDIRANGNLTLDGSKRK